MLIVPSIEFSIGTMPTESSFPLTDFTTSYKFDFGEYVASRFRDKSLCS